VTAVRTVLTVVVAAALVGASMPAVADARVERTTARLDATATRLVDTAAALAASDDPVPAGEQGAARTVVVVLPAAGVADASTGFLSIGGLPNRSAPSTVGYRVDGHRPRQVASPVAFVTGPTPLVLGPGRHRLRLTLVHTATGVGVAVRPVSRRPQSSTTVPDGDD
jgi:hypothetical protein